MKDSFTDPNPFKAHKTEVIRKGKQERFSIRKLGFLSFAFVLFVLSFYVALSIHAFTTPYLREYLAPAFFLDYAFWAFAWASILTIVVFAITARKSNFGLVSLSILSGCSLISFASCFVFFIGFFGI
jgi:hypothetical protein